jgi:hypothetical protein
VTLQLEDEIDLSRGDMLVSPENGPRVSRRFRAMVVWLHETPMEAGGTYLVKHTARQTKIRVLQIRHRVNVNTLEHEQATQLNMNDIASVEFEAHVPLFFDAYASNRTTGSFILIDAISNATVGAGMIQEDLPDQPELEGPELASPHMAQKRVSAQERYERHGHYPATFLLENRPALASRLERALFEQGFEVLHLNDDETSPYALWTRFAQRTGLEPFLFTLEISSNPRRNNSSPRKQKSGCSTSLRKMKTPTMKISSAVPWGWRNPCDSQRRKTITER